MITFLVSGLWHGANWTFVIWGGLNVLFQIVGGWMKLTPRLPKVLNIFCTFVLMTIAWTFLKAYTLSDALLALQKMIVPTGALYKPNASVLLYSAIEVVILMVCDVLQERNGKHPLLENRYMAVRFAAYVALAMLILTIGVFDGGQFIYFQF